jgi:hypothetical protein
MGRSVCVCVCVCARARACVCVHVMRAWVSPITFSCSNTASVDVARTLLTRFLSASSWDRSAYPRTGQLSVAGQQTGRQAGQGTHDRHAQPTTDHSALDRADGILHHPKRRILSHANLLRLSHRPRGEPCSSFLFHVASGCVCVCVCVCGHVRECACPI